LSTEYFTVSFEKGDVTVNILPAQVLQYRCSRTTPAEYHLMLNTQHNERTTAF